MCFMCVRPAQAQSGNVVRVSPDCHPTRAIYGADGLKQIASFPTKKSPMGFGLRHGAQDECHDENGGGVRV